MGLRSLQCRHLSFSCIPPLWISKTGTSGMGCLEQHQCQKDHAKHLPNECAHKIAHIYGQTILTTQTLLCTLTCTSMGKQARSLPPSRIFKSELLTVFNLAPIFLILILILTLLLIQHLTCFWIILVCLCLLLISVTDFRLPTKIPLVIFVHCCLHIVDFCLFLTLILPMIWRLVV